MAELRFRYTVMEESGVLCVAAECVMELGVSCVMEESCVAAVC